MEAVTDFIFLSSKITSDGDCSHEIERHLLLGRKAKINLDRVFKKKKIRDITLPTKVCLVKATVFPKEKSQRHWYLRRSSELVGRSIVRLRGPLL